jgi:hypothetical protein
MPRQRSVAPSAIVLALCLAHEARGAAPPIVKGPYLQQLGSTQVEIRLEVDPPAAVVIEASPAQDKAKPITVSDEARPFHSVLVQGLTPLTQYNYVATVLGAKSGGTFTTAPPADGHVPFTFLIYGDNRSDDTAHAVVARALSQARSDFLVHTGDFVENGSNAAEWQTFFDIEEPLLRDRCVFTCVGNHELLEAQGVTFVRYFGPGESSADDGGKASQKLFGSMRWENARFIFLNGMDAWSTGTEKQWLESELRMADAEEGLTWRFVVVHYGPWSSGPHGSNRRLLDAGLPAILRAHKVDLVLSGHDHIYERGEQDGLRYVVSGGGGAPLYRQISPRAGTEKVEPTYHFIEATVTDDAVKLVAKRIDGSILDRCGFTKASGWDCAPNPAAPSSGDSGDGGGGPQVDRPAAADATPPASASKCGCSLVGQGRGSHFGAPLAILSLLGRRRARRTKSLKALPS